MTTAPWCGWKDGFRVEMDVKADTRQMDSLDRDSKDCKGLSKRGDCK